MRSAFNFAVAAVGVAAIAGCGSRGGGSYVPKPVKESGSAAVAEGKEQALFPMAVGNQWVYDVQGRALDKNGREVSFGGEVTWKMVKVDDIAGGKRATIDVVTGGKVTDRQIWVINDKGLFQTSIGAETVTNFEPPIPAIVFPVKEGRVFEWKGIGVRPNMKPGPSATKSTIKPSTDVDVVTGPALPSIPVETDTDFKGFGLANSTAYFSPNVGIVRYVHIVKGKVPTQLLLRLKSHRFPNVSK